MLFSIRCVLCTHCGATSPGLRCEWQNNYTQCGPCASLMVCPVCAHSYTEEELILQCRQCDRWVALHHAKCHNGRIKKYPGERLSSRLVHEQTQVLMGGNIHHVEHVIFACFVTYS